MPPSPYLVCEEVNCDSCCLSIFLNDWQMLKLLRTRRVWFVKVSRSGCIRYHALVWIGVSDLRDLINSFIGLASPPDAFDKNGDAFAGETEFSLEYFLSVAGNAGSVLGLLESAECKRKMTSTFWHCRGTVVVRYMVTFDALDVWFQR